MTTFPDQETAQTLARQLVESRLAACVNVLGPCQSIYHWQGKLHEDGEFPVIIKTVAGNYPRVEAFIREHHPYQLPEVVAIDAAGGLPDYLAWIASETNSEESA